MGVFDNELFLPGTITEIESDYSYGYDVSLFGTTDSVTIMGTAFNGPVGKPVKIYSPEHAKYIFGGTYDYKTRRESTLVAEIVDAWDRGCRTIYGVRLSGKDISKDFNFAVETDLKLRVSGIFPSNDNKDVYFFYDDTNGAQKLKIFKPAKRATIQEKMQGLVEKEESIIVSTLDISNSYSITKDTRLVELIKIFNEHSYNNVMRLSIVDANGNDVTISSKEAQALSVGAMFGGAYFVGRDSNKCDVATDVPYVFADATHKPYETFDGMIYKTLVLNTDITSGYPIYGTLAALNEKFLAAGVVMSSMFDILEVPGKIDSVFEKDAIDYEEVGISDFDLYKRLGSGYAITAKAEFKGATTDIKVKETPASDEANRVQPIVDGIYSMLENLKSDYRILANGAADTQIIGKIPKKADFLKTSAKELPIFGGKIIATPKIAPDAVATAKKYGFELREVATGYGDAEGIRDILYITKIVKLSATLPTAVDGELYMFNKEVYKDGAKVIPGFFGNNTATIPAPFEYVLVESDNNVSVYSIIPEVEGDDFIKLEPVGGVGEVFDTEEDKTLVTIQSEFGMDNMITIKSAVLDYTTMEEFIELLNSNADLAKLFSFKIASASALEKDEYVADVYTKVDDVFSSTVAADDRTQGYDTSIYIPYKTTDNFARHLAQHCTYTSLKTAPTHGIIGCSKLLDVNLNSVARKVDAVSVVDLNLYAKKSNGRDMLDKNNMPYPIGKNISVVVGQYIISSEGYNYISNGASGYAGMISILPLDQSSTAQAINIPSPMYEMTNYQLEKLTKAGFVTFKQSYTKGFVVTDGITMAPVTSPFRRLSVTKIINAVEEVIRAATEPFIGKQNHLTNRNSMQTAITSELEKLKGKLIEAFEFKLTVDPATLKLGVINIDYVLIPIYEIKEVRNRLTVKEAV